MMAYLYIFIGGGLGSMARFGLTRWVSTFFSSAFPLGILLVNVLSCFLIGFFSGYIGSRLIQQSMLWLFISTGFCGGFSTFSAFGFDTLELIRSGNFYYAGANILLSLVLCLLAVGAGLAVGK